MKEKISILGVPVDNLTMDETVNHIIDAVHNRKQIHQTAVNAYILTMLKKDSLLKESILSSDLINADGQSVVWASKFLGTPLKERVTGIDLMEKLIEISKKKKYTAFFLGAKPEVVKKVAEKCGFGESNSIVAGYKDGYFKDEEQESIARYIADSKPNFLFVAITSPKKEIFLHKHKAILKDINLTMGVGGSFDVYSGLINRAPHWMQKSGLEWLYRMIQEPRRMWKRYTLNSIHFIFLVLLQRLFSKNDRK